MAIKSVREPTISLSKEIKQKIVDGAGRAKLSPIEFLTFLLDGEYERQYFLTSLEDAKEKSESDAVPTQRIATLANQYLGQLTSEHEMKDAIQAVKLFYRSLLKEKIITTKVLPSRVTESKHFKITKIGYYYHGSILAKYLSMWFGTFEVYLDHPLFCVDRAVVFIGMPNNIEACFVAMTFLFNYLEQIKIDYLAQLNKRIKKQTREEFANKHVYEMSKLLENTAEYWLGNEDDYGFLFDYAEKNYRWALR